MSDRARNVVMSVVLAGWLVVIGAYVAHGQLPDAALVGVPAAVILALAPPRIGRRSRDDTPAKAAEKEPS